MATLNPPLPPTPVPVSARWALGIGLTLALGLVAVALTAVDQGGQAVLWENAHWTLFYAVGFAMAVYGVRTAIGPERRVRVAIALASAFWLAGQVVWLVQGLFISVGVPSPSDFVLLATIGPVVVALDLAVRQARDRRQRLGLYLDAAITFLATATVMTLLFGRLVMSYDVFAGAVLLSFPIAFLSLAGAGLIAALGGMYALLVGTLLIGAAYLPWVASAPLVIAAGSWSNYLFSVGAVAIGLAGATFRLDSQTTQRAERLGSFIRDGLPVVAVAVAVGCLVAATISDTTSALVRPLGWGVILTAVFRQVLLVRERTTAVREAEESARHLSVAEERHRRLIETIPAVVYIDERLTVDVHDSTMTYVSAEANRLLSYTPLELMADPELWFRLVHPDDVAAVAAAEDEHFVTGQPLHQTFRMRGRDGREIWVLDEATLE